MPRWRVPLAQDGGGEADHQHCNGGKAPELGGGIMAPEEERQALPDEGPAGAVAGAGGPALADKGGAAHGPVIEGRDDDQASATTTRVRTVFHTELKRLRRSQSMRREALFPAPPPIGRVKPPLVAGISVMSCASQK